MHRVYGSGEPVVFVHGNGSTHETWNAVAEAVCADFSCFTYDLRGHGGPHLDEPRIEEFVDDLERLRVERGLERMRLVGHSLGSFIAAAYCNSHPTRVRALALLATPAGRTMDDLEAGRALIARLRREGVAKVMSSLVESWYRPDFLARHPDALAQRLKQIASIPDEVFIKTYALYVETEINPLLDVLAVPALVMTGEHARGCDADVARAMAGRLATAELVVFPGLRNGILTEIPEAVASELVRFFRAN